MLDLLPPESLTSRDQQICSSLEEKLQVYAALSALGGRSDGLPVGSRLLVQRQWEEPPLQAAALLAAAVKEGETLLHMHGCAVRRRLPLYRLQVEVSKNVLIVKHNLKVLKDAKIHACRL